MASFLRRRIVSDDDSKQNDSDKPESPETAEEVRLAPVSKIMTASHLKQRNKKRTTGFIFFLGGLFGLLLAGFFAGKNDLIELPQIGEFSMDNLIEALPAGFIKDARDLSVCVSFPQVKSC